MHVEKRTGREGEGREKKTGGRTGARHFSAEKCGEGKPVEECGNGRSKSEGRPVEKRGNGRSKSEGQSVEKRGNGRSKSARTDGREARRRAVEERGTGGREARERTIEERGNGRSKSAGIQKRVGVGGGNTGPCGWRLTTSRDRTRARSTVYRVPPGEPSYHATKICAWSTRKSFRRA